MTTEYVVARPAYHPTVPDRPAVEYLVAADLPGVGGWWSEADGIDRAARFTEDEAIEAAARHGGTVEPAPQ